MPKTKFKSHKESGDLVQEVRNAMWKAMTSKTKHVEPNLRWLICSRAMAANFWQFYGMSLNEANKRTEKAQMDKPEGDKC
jgi:hypothetical protein